MTKRQLKTRWTFDDVARALGELDVPSGSITLVHSSVVALGPSRDVSPRDVPAALLRALRDHVGPDGTIVVPTFTFAFCRGEPFDLSTSPSEQMGAFAEEVRVQSESLRSSHPMQSISANGPHAAHLTEPDTLTAFGVGSCWHRILEADATVLMLGAPLQTASLVHWSEEQAEVPYRYMKLFHGSWRRSPDEAFSDRDYAMFVRDLTIDPMLELSILEGALGDEMRSVEVGAGSFHTFSASAVVGATDRLLADDPWALVGGWRCEKCAARPWACTHIAPQSAAGKE